MTFFYLYIDPGTGSMLFSILIGATATLFFLAKALWLKVKMLVTGGKLDVRNSKSYKDFVIYCEDARYWNVFKPVLDEFEKRQIDVTYYVATDEDPVFNENYRYIHSEVIGEGNKAYTKLNFLSAGIVLMTTPGLQVYQLKRSRNVRHYSHIFHSPGDPTMYRLFGIDYFDSILCTGDYQFQDIRTMEKQRNLPPKELITVGCTYLDVFKKKMDEISSEKNHKFTVLVSPSWGPSSLLSLYGEKLLTPLAETGWNIIIRPHPQSRISEKEVLERLTKRYMHTPNIVWDTNRDNFYSLKKADIMITDFSGIIWDYVFLCDKPVIYANAKMELGPYDAYDMNHEIWQFQTVRKIGIKLDENDFKNIRQVIENASDSPELAAERKKAKEQAWMYRGESGVKTVDYLIKKLAALNE